MHNMHKLHNRMDAFFGVSAEAAGGYSGFSSPDIFSLMHAYASQPHVTTAQHTLVPPPHPAKIFSVVHGVTLNNGPQ